MIALLLASTVSAATTPKAVNNRPRRPRWYHDITVVIVHLPLAIAKSRRERPRLAWVARGLSLTSGLFEALDCLEPAARLIHGQEHLIRAPIAGEAVGELEAPEIEGAGFLHGLDQGLPG